MKAASQSDGPLEIVVVSRTHELSDNFEVRRALPSRQRRMVGPYVFLDQMGPHVFSAGDGLDVRPHPHIGLATVTYLYEGEILHRDSLGVVQPIRPSEVNWMTAGRGVVHSERTAPDTRKNESPLFGVQCWVALPQVYEESEPSFSHNGEAELPVQADAGVVARVIAGAFHGKKSPVHTLSELYQVDILLQPGARIDVPPDYPERAIYVVHGTLDLGDDGIFEAGQLLVLNPGKSLVLRGGGLGLTRVMLVGGEPMDGRRYLSWNFVSSSPDLIEQAKEDWRAQRFPTVPEEAEYIHMPDIPGKAVFYPEGPLHHRLEVTRAP